MGFSVIRDLALLYAIGVVGWFLLRPLKLPVPSLLGSLAAIGGLRVAGVDLPYMPPVVPEIVQILLGFYVGSMITKEALRQIRALILPAGITMVWVVGLTFLAGLFLARVTFLDTLTGILASSTGGLPEMTVLAVATHADASVVIIMQLVRVVVIVIAFPFVIRTLAPVPGMDDAAVDVPARGEAVSRTPKRTVVLSGAMAFLGGGLFLYFGVPAGGMVGAIFFVILATMLGHNVHFSSRRMLELLLVGVGMMAADNMTPEAGQILLSGSLVLPLLLSLIITLVSSSLLAFVLMRLSPWDYVTCLLAAAPAGLTVMTALALQSERDPIPVFVVHMCRVIILKTAIPFFIMLWL